MLRDEKEIRAEIAALQAIKPKVLQRSMFGDDHHAAIDGQIEVLKDHLTEDQVEDIVESEERPSNVRDAMLQACEWANSERGKSIAEEWKELVRP